MDREILFRAKHLNASLKNEYLRTPWVEGYLCDENHINSVKTGGEFLIDPETVCQYTGLTDENDRKIFEGDIVKFRHGGKFSEDETYFRNYVVEFVNTFVTYGLRLRNKRIHFPFKQATACMHDAEVIGNIFDNPDLLASE